MTCRNYLINYSWPVKSLMEPINCAVIYYWCWSMHTKVIQETYRSRQSPKTQRVQNYIRFRELWKHSENVSWFLWHLENHFQSAVLFHLQKQEVYPEKNQADKKRNRRTLKKKHLEYFTKLVKDSTEFFILASWPPQA